MSSLLLGRSNAKSQMSLQGPIQGPWSNRPEAADFQATQPLRTLLQCTQIFPAALSMSGKKASKPIHKEKSFIMFMKAALGLVLLGGAPFLRSISGAASDERLGHTGLSGHTGVGSDVCSRLRGWERLG